MGGSGKPLSNSNGIKNKREETDFSYNFFSRSNHPKVQIIIEFIICWNRYFISASFSQTLWERLIQKLLCVGTAGTFF